MRRHIIYTSLSMETLSIRNVVIYFVFTNGYPLSNLYRSVDTHKAKDKEGKKILNEAS